MTVLAVVLGAVAVAVAAVARRCARAALGGRSSSQVRDASGRIVGAVGTGIDLTDSRET